MLNENDINDLFASIIEDFDNASKTVECVPQAVNKIKLLSLAEGDKALENNLKQILEIATDSSGLEKAKYSFLVSVLQSGLVGAIFGRKNLDEIAGFKTNKIYPKLLSTLESFGFEILQRGQAGQKDGVRQGNHVELKNPKMLALMVKLHGKEHCDRQLAHFHEIRLRDFEETDDVEEPEQGIEKPADDTATIPQINQVDKQETVISTPETIATTVKLETPKVKDQLSSDDFQKNKNYLVRWFKLDSASSQTLNQGFPSDGLFIKKRNDEMSPDRVKTAKTVMNHIDLCISNGIREIPIFDPENQYIGILDLSTLKINQSAKLVVPERYININGLLKETTASHASS